MLKRTDPGTEPPRDERPIGDLVQQLVDDGKAYAKAEIDVAKAITNAKLRALALPAGLIFGAMLVAQAAVTIFAAGVFFELYKVIDPILAGLLAFVLFAAVAGGLGWYAVRRVKQIL